MIALALVAALAGQSPADDRPALIAQAVDQIAAPYGELTYALGLCAKTYPLGGNDLRGSGEARRGRDGDS